MGACPAPPRYPQGACCAGPHSSQAAAHGLAVWQGPAARLCWLPLGQQSWTSCLQRLQVCGECVGPQLQLAVLRSTQGVVGTALPIPVRRQGKERSGLLMNKNKAMRSAVVHGC